MRLDTLRIPTVWCLPLVLLMISLGVSAQAPPAEQDAAKAQQAQKLAAEALNAPAMVDNSIGMKLALIPQGTFTMGSPAGETERSNETQHQVTISKPFRMAVTEVTQAQWKAVMGTDPSHFKGADLPVETVSWDDAVAFCRKLSETEGKTYRLPTEAEWEYACRAGTTTAYYTGDGEAALQEAGWYLGNSGDRTRPVGQKKPNAWGLYDVHGNVWEWCSDWEGKYPAGAATDPKGPDNGSDRVLRGGSWNFLEAICRSAYRFSTTPHRRNARMGFRVVLDLSE